MSTESTIQTASSASPTELASASKETAAHASRIRLPLTLPVAIVFAVGVIGVALSASNSVQAHLGSSFTGHLILSTLAQLSSLATAGLVALSVLGIALGDKPSRILSIVVLAVIIIAVTYLTFMATVLSAVGG